MAKMTMDKYERSGADKKADRREAKKEGKSAKAFEGSKKDRQMDRAAVAKANKRKG